MTNDPPSGLDGVMGSAADSTPAPDLRVPADAEADAYDVAELGDDCPVTPLGSQGKINWFLNWRGELFDLSSRCEKGELMMLFGVRMGFLDIKWTAWKAIEVDSGEVDGKGKPKKRTTLVENGFDQTKAQKGLILACAKLPLFDPTNKVRGRGAHPGPGGEIVMHCGDALIVGGRRGTRGQAIKTQTYKVGKLGDYVYPRGPTLPHPDERPAEVNIAMEVLAKFETWNWKQGDIAAHLLLCLVGVMMVCGALRRRPHGWIVGPPGCGKSTLQKMIRDLLDGWVVTTEDATEAGVRQLLDQDAIPVLFDEIEAEQENEEVVKKIIRLARLAYSEGASSLRGSTDHKHKQFAAASSFLFSSIHHHELPSQDRGRIAILHLAKFPPKTERFNLPATLHQWGAAMRRRMIEQWHRFRETFEAYAREMMEQGYSPREQDTYGTLLACGDLLLHNSAPPAAMSREQNRVEMKVRALGRVLDAVRSESIDTTERCIGHLQSTRLPAAGGAMQETVARWIVKSLIQIANVKITGGRRKIANPARDKLLQHGMALVHLGKDHADGNGQGGLIEAYNFEALDPETPDDGRLVLDIWLAVANATNAGMKEIFKASAWSSGNWTQPLALIPGALSNKARRFGGPKEGCTLVPLREIIDIVGALQDAHDAARQGELDDAAGAPEVRG